MVKSLGMQVNTHIQIPLRNIQTSENLILQALLFYLIHLEGCNGVHFLHLSKQNDDVKMYLAGSLAHLIEHCAHLELMTQMPIVQIAPNLLFIFF